jgi:N-acetylglucosamine-6-phosphate deacetylase
MTSPVAPKASLAIETSRLFDGERLVGSRRVEIADGRILSVLKAGRSLETGTVVRLPEALILAPGFIDVQVNGGGDALLNDDPSLETIRRIAAAHRRFGTTGLLPTLITDHPSKLQALAEVADEAMQVPGVLGFHLEGPHLNLARKGIHPPQFIRPMTEADRNLLTRFGKLGRSQVTLAPELCAGEVIQSLVRAGLRVSAGHTEAKAGELIGAVERGLSGVTHLFNAMSQMTAREPGVVGVAMADERLFAGIIPDGICVSPMNLKTAYRAIGRDRLMIVTDAMPTSAGTRSSFLLQGRRITLKDGRLSDEHGTLAGAHLIMNEAIANSMAMMDAPIEDALMMASLTPARFLGLEGERGRIASGWRADLVVLDDRINVHGTWIAGTN